jgi:hypothetical protein
MTAANCATLRPLFRRLLPSLGFQSSGGRTSNPASNVQYLGTTDAKAKKSANRSSSRNDELELGGMGPKGFGTATSAWHHDEQSDKEDDTGSNHSQTMIINTKTSIYRSEENSAPGGGKYWKEDRKS